MDNNSLLEIVPPGKRNNQPKLFYYFADEISEFKNCHEISVKSLFQYLINENSDPFIEKKLDVPKWLKIIDHKSQIIQVETHRQIVNSNSDSNGLTDIFIVFQTRSENDGDFWWSLDKFKDHVIVQLSHDKDAVKNNLIGERREGIEIIAEKIEGKGCIRELFTLLWINMIVDIKYQCNLSRCESIIPLIMTKITKKRYEYKSDFKYSALSAEEKNPDLKDIIDFLSNVSNWHPLVIAIYSGDIELLDRVQKIGKYNVNGVYNKFTLLNLAILFSKIEMIRHLLQNMNVNPLKRDEMGRNALHMTAKFNREMEIIELLLLNRKIEIDQCSTNGTTALNYAIMASNTNIVQCLLDKGANPKRLDRKNRSPLHVAAIYSRDTKIIDLLLQHKEKVDINESNKFGLTALHHSAKTSNYTIAHHLMKKGANVNCRDKRGLTPLHLAAFCAKDMDMINLLLNNKKIDLYCCDEVGQNVVAYAKKNIYGLRQQIIDRLNAKDGGIIKQYNLLKQAKSDMPDISIWKKLIWNPENKPKFFFIPCADLKPGKGWNVSQSTFIQYIANEESIQQLCSAQSEVFESPNNLSYIDPYSKIEQVKIYQSNIILMLDGTTVSHYFMNFKTNSQEDGDYWWSLEKSVACIVLQRSRDKETVKNTFNGKERSTVTPTINNLIGMRGTIRNLFAVLWAYQIIQEKYPKKLSDCQSFVHFVSKRITEIGYDSHFSKESDAVNIDFVNNLSSSISKWHPLFLAICLGNTKLFDEIQEMTTFDYCNNELTPLNLAIALPNKTEMVQHLLEEKKADPTLRDGLGRNALEMAAIHADKAEIIDLILAHQNEKVNIDGCDESGWTALHFAVASSNVFATRRLIEKGAKPNVFDSHGFSPLHLAAYYSDNTDLMELILKALKEKGVDKAIDIVENRTSDGNTALHTAVIASNDFTTEYLIKKGANPNIQDKNGRTPLHLAAFNAMDMKIINVLLSNKKIDVNSLDNFERNALYYAKHNQNGLSEETVSRLQEVIVKKNIGDYSAVLLPKFFNIKIGIVRASFTLLYIFILPLFLAMEKSQKEMYGWVMLLTIIIVLFIHFVCAFAYKIPRLSLIEFISKLRNLKIKLRILIGSWIHFLMCPYITFPLFEIKNLLYIPNADQQFLVNRWNFFNMGHKSSCHEISQDALSRYLLNKDTADFIDKLNSDGSSKTFDYKMCQMLDYLRDFKKEYHITNLEVYQSDVNWLKSNLLKFHHTFIVFKTTSQSDGDYWWSLDHNPENIVIQRSRNKIAVVNRLMGKDRKNVQIVKRKDDEAKGTMFDLLTTLWAHNVFPENDDVVKSNNRQTFLQFIEKANNQSVAKFIKRQNKEEAKSKQKKISFKPIVSYSSPLNKNQLDSLSDLINKFPKWKPLCAIIYLGDHIQLENLLGNSGNIPQDNNVILVHNGTTLLRMAILFSRTKMVEILLQNENLNFTFENEVRSDTPWKDMSIFHMAAAFAKDTKIIDLLLKQSKIKTDPDEKGRNALHFAAMKSNEIIVSHLLKIKWVDPNTRDKNGISPLHLAAEHTDNAKIIDLILEAKKALSDSSSIDDCDSKGRTALHHAAIGSNVTIARHLMEKGANPNQTDNDGNTPVELAAQLAKDMKIIDLFLNNESVCKELEENGGDQIYNCAIKNKTAGLYKEIKNRLRNKNIIPKEDQLPTIPENLIHDVIKIQNLLYENTTSKYPYSYHSDRFSAHGVPSNMQMHMRPCTLIR